MVLREPGRCYCIFDIPFSPNVLFSFFVKHSYYLFAVFLLVGGQPAAAQTARDQAEARTLYHQANAAPASANLRAAMARQSSGFFGDGTFQRGALRTYDGRYRPVPGLRFHAGLHLLEAQDSVEVDSTHLWPVGSLRGFDLGETDDTRPALRRFRTRLVKEGSAGSRREFVEVLTAVDAGPLLLAWLHASGADATAGRLSLVPLLLVGAGNAPTEPLRPLELNQTAVLRLFGARGGDVQAFATTNRLHFDQAVDVARMIDHYNRVAVVK